MQEEKDLFNQKFDIPEKSHGLSESSEGVLEGEVHKVLFTSEDETYSVVKIKCKNSRIYTVVGALSGAFEGQGIQVKGKWEEHKEFGRQLRVEKFRFSLPITPKGVERYLASGLIPGIGPKRAKQIVYHFKKNTLNVLDNFSSRLAEIPGFGKKTVKTVQESWKEHSEKRDVILYFQSLGISLAYCQKIYKRFGAKSLEVVKNNPYKLASEVFGIGFLKADLIANHLGISHNDDKRLEAGNLYAIRQLAQNGHVCYPLNEFINYCSELLNVERSDTERGLFICCNKKSLIIEQLPVLGDEFTDVVYSMPLYKSEVKLSGVIARLISSGVHRGKSLCRIKSKNIDLKLNSQQLRAVENCGRYPFSVITGGPGVGKTTIIGEIVRRAKTAGLKVSLAAPTGKAAKRLGEATGMNASTIHRLLKWDPSSSQFSYNDESYLSCDLLILDEVSMIDIQLACSLFSAVAPKTTCVLVGDVDQLPSVGPGSFLKDLIDSKICPVTRLTEIYRQSSMGRIIPNAHAVNSGKMIDLNSERSGSELSDFYWIEQDDQEKVSELIVKMITDRIPRRFGFDPLKDIQVLTPMTKGVCGAKNLNQTIQKSLLSTKRVQFEFGEKTYMAGDKVMQITNNYDKNVFNGDSGFITGIDTKEKLFKVIYDQQLVEYEFNEADQIIHAYAITIHKSQGSEFPAVIIPCLSSHFIMLQRNLLYTAITRAKKLLILIGSKKALNIAISNYRQSPRFSCFRYRLTKFKTVDVEF